ncbi:MAG TPA: aliphatic sulfonate ABC transporter substrate-binding protein [Ruania sp.]|nr:aliphatic sulfonate ABC transporter substrate-binding protein [Ruania sp.]
MRAGIVKGAIAALASVSLLAACGGGDDGAGAGGGSDHTWRLGYNVDYNSASLYAIAEDQGLWEEHGVDVKTLSFTNGPLQIQALNQGDLDIAYIGPGAHWLPASGKAKIITINGLGTAERILAQPGITSMKDLAGHTVGAPEGTSGELLLNLALEEAGMTKEDIDFVPMDPSTVVSSFSSGKVDAAAIWYPLVGTMKKNVPDAEELSSSEDFVDEVPAPSSFVTTQEIIDSEQDGLSDVIAVLKEANDFRAKNQDEAIALTSQFLDVDEESLAQEAQFTKNFTSEELEQLTEEGTTYDWLDNLAEQLEEMGTIKGERIPAEEFYMGDLYTGAQ